MKYTNIKTVTAFIKNNPHIHAKAVAEHFGYSQFHFSRWFKREMGVCLRDYLSAVKIEKGTQALINNQSVTTSQLDAGFESVGTFSNTFKKFSGYSPKLHSKKLTNFIESLHNLHSSTFTENLLYMPFKANKHAQTQPLHIRINNRSHPESLLFLALFPQALPKGIPSLGVCMKRQQHYCVTHIPNGHYFVMVIEVLPVHKPLNLQKIGTFHLDQCKRDIIRTPFSFPLSTPKQAVLTLREKQPQDPPINTHPLKLLFDVITPNTTLSVT